METEKIEITSEQVKEYRNKITAHRKESTTVLEFFGKMTKTLKEMFNVDMKISEVPSMIDYKSSSCNSPIGKKRAWNQKQKDDPDIPNEYKAVIGNLSGTITVPEDFKYYKTEFECMRLFWCFGMLDMDFLHGTPNGSKYKWEGNIETFDIKIFLFLEDFPTLYRTYRLDDKVDRCDQALSQALNDYKKDTNEVISKVKNEDEVLFDIQEQIQRLNESRQILNDLSTRRNKYLTDQVYADLPPLPKINNNYLNLNEYNNMKKQYKVSNIPKPGSKEIFDKVNKVIKNFKDYQNQHAEDFL